MGHKNTIVVLRCWSTVQVTRSKKAESKSINDISPNRAIAVAGDVMDAAYIDALVKKSAEFGGGKIHIIVNNAGFTWDGVIHKVRPLPLCLVAARF